jgi:triacylglycerol lipase
MVLSKSALVAVTFAIVAAQAAWAQQNPMPEEIAAKLQELGRVIDAPKTGQLYAPLQGKEPYQGVKVERDVKYGAADRNLLGHHHGCGSSGGSLSAGLNGTTGRQ